MTSFPKYDESKRIMGKMIVTPDNIVQIMNSRSLLCLTTTSYTMGMPKTAAKGHPNNAEIAVKNIASLYFCVHHAAKAAIEKYIENELGRNDADEMNMPALNN